MIPSQYFARHEFACNCGCGFDTVDAELLDVLTAVRKSMGARVIISSGCRCLEYNRKCGSKDTSQHVRGRAADFVVEDVPASEVQDFLEAWFPDEYGIGKYDNFTHLDTASGKRRWKG